MFNTLSKPNGSDDGRICAPYADVWLLISLPLMLFTGCAVAPERGPMPSTQVDVSAAPDGIPRNEPKSRYGNPPSYVVFGKRYFTRNSSVGFRQRGIASWYGRKFHGRRTSSGEIYDMFKMTAAHKELPLPTYVQVKNLENGRRVIVRVNDRGPFHGDRIIDLSYAAARKLDMIGKGTGYVEVHALDPRNAPPRGQYVRRTVPPPLDQGFYLQVGAFAHRENAERMMSRLATVNVATLTMSEKRQNGMTLYRVRMGPLVNSREIDRLVETLNRMGVADTKVVMQVASDH